MFKGLADCICIKRNVNVENCIEEVGNEALNHRLIGRVLISVVGWGKCKISYLFWFPFGLGTNGLGRKISRKVLVSRESIV